MIAVNSFDAIMPIYHHIRYYYSGQNSLNTYCQLMGVVAKNFVGTGQN
jgi:hypothetical protein